jgi:NADPH-dependent glutamate synthase beta subunit-like oxidoreductase
MDQSYLDTPRHAVAVIGGACSGAEAAEIFAKAGILTVVFEMNARPFGKIEDGLPRWHARQRMKEYVRIGEKLKAEGIVYVPSTTIGQDITFEDLRSWGFSAVVLGCGAWDDRKMGVEGEDEAVGKGLVYQNPFIYWFNHHEEASYSGERYDIHDGCLVVGGGLASIDVVKAINLELAAAKLRERGIECDVCEMEHKGLAKSLEAHGLTMDDLGLKGCTLVYRRSAAEMPVAQYKPGADEESRKKTEAVREKLMGLTQTKYLNHFSPNTLPKEILFDDDGNVCGLRVIKTRTEGRKVIELEGTEHVMETTQIYSSIGSVPRPIGGLPMRGDFYEYDDWDLGKVKDMPEVFGVGNVVTGQGNIAISRKHAKKVSDVVLQEYLGLGEKPLDEPEGVLKNAEARGADAAGAVMESLNGKDRLAPEKLQELVEKARARGSEVGYDGNFDAWIEANTPPDLQ